MALIRLDITNFRNLALIELEPLPVGFNIISGNNGSGKTSLLEAIHFLSFGRSFRCSLTDRIINNMSNNFSVFAHFLASSVQVIPVGLERHRNKSVKLKLEGENQSSIAEITRLIPVRLMNSQNYGLVDGGPIFRRKYLDWGLFYLNNDFLSLWRRFERVLRQRNAALRSRLPRKEVEIWTEEFVETALLFDACRQNYVKHLTPLLLDFLGQLLDNQFDIAIDYQRGWDGQQNLETILADFYYKDAGLGYTQLGPHKADLKLIINGISAKDFLSRGQQKLFVCAMILAQGKLLSKLANKSPIFLVDDLPSELDSNSLSKIMGLLGQQNTQVFVTAINPQNVTEFLNGSTKMFHVEQGRVLLD